MSAEANIGAIAVSAAGVGLTAAFGATGVVLTGLITGFFHYFKGQSNAENDYAMFVIENQWKYLGSRRNEVLMKFYEEVSTYDCFGDRKLCLGNKVVTVWSALSVVLLLIETKEKFVKNVLTEDFYEFIGKNSLKVHEEIACKQFPFGGLAILHYLYVKDKIMNEEVLKKEMIPRICGNIISTTTTTSIDDFIDDNPVTADFLNEPKIKDIPTEFLKAPSGLISDLVFMNYWVYPMENSQYKNFFAIQGEDSRLTMKYVQGVGLYMFDKFEYFYEKNEFINLYALKIPLKNINNHPTKRFSLVIIYSANKSKIISKVNLKDIDLMLKIAVMRQVPLKIQIPEFQIKSYYSYSQERIRMALVTKQAPEVYSEWPFMSEFPFLKRYEKKSEGSRILLRSFISLNKHGININHKGTGDAEQIRLSVNYPDSEQLRTVTVDQPFHFIIWSDDHNTAVVAGTFNPVANETK